MTYYTYAIKDIPNQVFNTNIGNRNFEFELRSFRGYIYVSVRIDGEIACAGVRAIPNQSLFPATVNDAAGGIFAFLCPYSDYPTAENMNTVACRFAFCQYSEMENG